MKECKRGFQPGAIAIAIAIAFAICALPPIAPDASAERFDDRFPASPWALKPDADVAVTNQFAVLSNELAGIAAMLGKDGEQCHETLSRLPEECRPGFVRSLYADFLKKGPESPFGFGRSGDQPGAVIRNRRKWMRLHSDEDVAAGRLRNRMARAAFISSLQSSGRPFPETVQLGMFLASCSVWIDSGIMEDPKAPDRRREEDGIPSAEALLEWFAGNGSFCKRVRKEAESRLDSLQKTAIFTPLHQLFGDAERGIGPEPPVYVPRRGMATTISYSRSLHGACYRKIRQLVMRQAENGSWSNDPGLTAMSVLAIVPYWTDDPVFETEFRASLEKGLTWLASFIGPGETGGVIDDSGSRLAAAALEAARLTGHDMSGKTAAESVPAILPNRNPEHPNGDMVAAPSETVRKLATGAENRVGDCMRLFLRDWTSGRFAALSPQDKMELCRKLAFRNGPKPTQMPPDEEPTIESGCGNANSAASVRAVSPPRYGQDGRFAAPESGDVMAIVDTALSLFMIGACQSSLAEGSPDFSAAYAPIQDWLASLPGGTTPGGDSTTTNAASANPAME